jgi:small subunit ribosomal protein S8
VIQNVKRISRPGRRVYCATRELPRVLDGLGIAIVSTSRGVLSDRQCRELNVGGELLCTVW